MFLGPLGVGTAGVVLPLEGEATLITISFSNLLGHEEFLNKSLDCKGASGLLCCMACKNTTLCSSGLAQRGRVYVVDIAEADAKRFDLRTDQDFWDQHDAHADAAAIGERKLNEKLSGP